MARKQQTGNKSFENGDSKGARETKLPEPDEKSGSAGNPSRGEAAAPKSLHDILNQTSPEKIEELSRNLTEALFESQEILKELTSSHLKGASSSPASGRIDPFGTNRAMARVAEDLARHPEKMMSAQFRLWEGHVNIWRSFLTGAPSAPAPGRNFSDPEWQTNPFFDLIRKTYELNSKWLLDLVDDADALDDITRRKARFLARQTADAFSPNNFFSTNPTALKAMIETGGKSVLDGLRLAHQDIQRGHGRLLISQTDGSAFEVGKNLATAPGKVVFRNELIELLQYEACTEKVYETPLLIFPPWINKFYILDLREENSMIRWLTEQGYTVFLVSWRSADHSMAHLGWDDYVRSGAYAAVEQVCARAGTDHVNTVGYCIGGTLLSGVLARMAEEDDSRITSATFFASQSDFEDAGDLLVFTDDESLSYIEELIAQNGGVMAGEDMGDTFNYLRPADLVWRYVVDSYLLGKKPRPFDLLYWNADQTNIPGPTHMTYLHDLYKNNALSNGTFKILGEPVNLQNVKIPVLLQASREDHISPCRSVYRAALRYGGKVEFLLSGSGHIAGVINHPAAKKYQHWVNPELPGTLDSWIQDAEQHEGSWWPYWNRWLKKLSGKKIPFRPVEDCDLGNAPGHYVTLKLEDLGVGPLAK